MPGTDSSSADVHSAAADAAAERKRLSQDVNEAINRGEFKVAFERASEAAARYEAARDAEGIAHTLFLLGLCYRRLNDLPASLTHHEKSYARYQALGDVMGCAKVLRAKSGTLRLLGRDDEAIADLRECGAIYREAGEHAEEMRTLTNLSISYKQAGDVATSQELLYQCLAFFEQADQSTRETKSDLAKTLLNIAINYSMMEKTEETIRFAKQGILLFEAIEDSHSISMALCVLGTAYRRQNDHKTALEYFLRALHIAEQVDIHWTISMILDDVSTALVHLGRFDEAREALERCLSLNDDDGNRLVYCGNLLSLGKLYAQPEYAERDVETALHHLNRARQIAGELDAGMLMAEIHQALTDVYEQVGDYALALASFRAFHEADKRVFNDESARRVERLEKEKAQKDAAIAAFERDRARKDAEIDRLRLIEMARDLEKAERLRVEADTWARMDALTGVFNRRVLDQSLDEAFARALHEHSPLAVALVDVDYFKHINDRLGHGVGDDALRHIAQLLSANCRSGDLVARYGGEGFALLLPATDLPTAFALCEELRKTIAAQDWQAIHPKLASVSVSIGVSVLSEKSRDRLTVPAALVAEADQNLYRAKRGGRNQVAG